LCGRERHQPLAAGRCGPKGRCQTVEQGETHFERELLVGHRVCQRFEQVEEPWWPKAEEAVLDPSGEGVGVGELVERPEVDSDTQQPNHLSKIGWPAPGA